ncbi:MAG: guanylate kinase [Gammaproteobacteria bacterium]|nr:guanylate kinase [Gammaproteobacteria bacterium]
MKEGRLFIVSAPSGAGKTSLVAALLTRDDNLVVSVSHTTRARRPKETDGVDYYFVDPETFAAMVDEGAFLEHAEVFGNRYGTSRFAVAGELARGHDVVLEIDWQGACMVRAEFPDTLDIFILPPSLAELAARLKARGEDNPEVISRRMDEAQKEMSHYDDYANLVVNDNFEVALSHMAAIVEAARCGKRLPRQDVKTLVDELLSENQ